MIKSMTAYGRATKSTSIGQWVLELHCVNRRMLDISMHLSKELLRFDIEIRKWVSALVSRGQVTVRVYLLQEAAMITQSSSSLKEMKSAWEKIAVELGYDPKDCVSLSFLANQLSSYPTQSSIEDEQEILNVLKHLFQEASVQVLKMKETEGKALAEDIRNRLKIMEESFRLIGALAPDAAERYRNKLQERIQEVCTSGAECDERILREVAIYAERLDITEELTRLHSHLEQFRSLLDSDEKSVGRTLDFLTQEMNREINTIASKSAETEISRLVVMCKSELEKIREQTQNIE